MFCVNCGEVHEPSHKFCKHCGASLASNLGGADTSASRHPSAGAGPIPEQLSLENLNMTECMVITESSSASSTEYVSECVTASAQMDPPYALFVTFGISSSLLASVALFIFGESIAERKWVAPIVTVLALVLGTVVAKYALSRWRRISELETLSGRDSKRPPRVLRTGLALILLMMSGAISFGFVIGENRIEAAALSADLQRMNELGDRISNARNGVERTIHSYVQMYRTIEPDVEDLNSTFNRLKEELAVYDSKFPSHHEQTANTIASMDIGSRRMSLLKQQIAVAKALDLLAPQQQYQDREFSASLHETA